MYPNRIQAERVVRRMRHRPGLNAYHCPACHFYHVGNRFNQVEHRSRKDRYERRTKVDHLQYWDDA